MKQMKRKRRENNNNNNNSSYCCHSRIFIYHPFYVYFNFIFISFIHSTITPPHVHAGKSAAHRIMVKTPDEMYESNLNVNVDMMFGFTNYVRFNFTIFKI